MTFPTFSHLLFTLPLALLAVACGAGNNPPAPPQEFPAEEDQTTKAVLPPGYDCWATDSAHIEIELPPGFFDPASPAWVGGVDFEGVPLETGGPFELGDTDTVIRREMPLELPTHGETATVPIELVALNLQSVAPIVVQTVSGSQQWDVSVQLTARDTFGELRVGNNGLQGRPFRATIPVRPVLIFTNPANPTLQHEFPLEETTLEGSGVLDLDADDPAAGLFVPHFPLGPNFGGIELTGIDMGLRLRRAQPDPNRQLPIIDPGAVLEVPIEHIGRGAQISDLVNIGAGTVIGPNAVIGAGCLIGRDVLIAEGVVVGDGTVIEDGAILGGDVQVGPGGFIGAGAQIHRQSGVGPDVAIGPQSYIGARCILGANVTLLERADLRNGVLLGDRVVIHAGVKVAGDGQVPTDVVLSDDLLLGRLPNGSEQYGTVAELEAAGAAVLGSVSFGSIYNPDIVQSEVTSEVPIDPNALPAGLGNLQQDVDTAGTGTAAGPIKDRTYVRTTYDCDDFAGDMEEALTARGYTATFTVYYCWDSIFEGEPDAWRMPWEYKPSLLRAHAVTDIHQDGRVIWLEPQTGQLGIKLDFDNDGRTEYATNHNSRALTDGNYRIEVYPSRAAAVRAGVVLD